MDKNQLEKSASWLTSLLTGWGIKESWAKLITGALIGAAVAAGVLALGSCSTSVSQAADGSWAYSGVIVLPVNPEK